MIGLREDQQVRAQLVAGIATFLSSTTLQCGSGLARECGGSETDVLTDTPLSRASPLPHWIGGLIKLVAESPASKAAV
ncbi:hypothetical protein QF043_000170 [Pseudomonas sp. W3I7]|jgi:hypothetical protein|nr:hypothetical protein [Pseudomonas sp. W3I7]